MRTRWITQITNEWNETIVSRPQLIGHAFNSREAQLLFGLLIFARDLQHPIC